MFVSTLRKIFNTCLNHFFFKHSPGEGTYGTDECAFMSVFMTRSWEQLAATIQAYEELRGDDEEKTLLSVVKSEFTGSEEKLLTTIGKHAVAHTLTHTGIHPNRHMFSHTRSYPVIKYNCNRQNLYCA